MDTLTPMAELANRWGVTPNTVSRRLAFLGIKPERRGNLRYITASELALGDELQHHLTSGKPLELFQVPNKPEGGLVTRQVKEGGLVTRQVDQVTAIAAAITAAMQQQPPDPLRCAKALAEAAELGVPLSSIELAGVVGMAPATVSSWLDGHSPRPGFRLRRQKAGVAVWWIVERVSNADAIAVSKSNSPGTRSVGFNACLTVAAVALPYF